MKALSVILLAGGKGTRMQTSTPKQFMELNSKPLILYSLEFFQNFSFVKETVIVCHDDYQNFFKEQNEIPLKFAKPGKRRQDSVLNGLKEVDQNTHLIAIHDGARPFLEAPSFLEAVKAADEHGASALAVPLKFTVKEANTNGMIAKTLDRTSLFEIQTPQIIEQKLLWEGFNFIEKEELEVTDDLSLIEHLKKPAKLVMGSYKNIKITAKEDFALAKFFLENTDEKLL